MMLNCEFWAFLHLTPENMLYAAIAAFANDSFQNHGISYIL